jgi:hypothetical protein
MQQAPRICTSRFSQVTVSSHSCRSFPRSTQTNLVVLADREVHLAPNSKKEKKADCLSNEPSANALRLPEQRVYPSAHIKRNPTGILLLQQKSPAFERHPKAAVQLKR